MYQARRRFRSCLCQMSLPQMQSTYFQYLPHCTDCIRSTEYEAIPKTDSKENMPYIWGRLTKHMNWAVYSKTPSSAQECSRRIHIYIYIDTPWYTFPLPNLKPSQLPTIFLEVAWPQAGTFGQLRCQADTINAANLPYQNAIWSSKSGCPALFKQRITAWNFIACLSLSTTRTGHNRVEFQETDHWNLAIFPGSIF